MSGFGSSDQFLKQIIADAPLSRRTVLAAGGLSLLALGFSGRAQASEALITDGVAEAGEPLWGMAMAYGEGRLDIIDLDGSQILHSFEGFRATHAITPVEHLNRFVIHGARIDRSGIRAKACLLYTSPSPRDRG